MRKVLLILEGLVFFVPVLLVLLGQTASLLLISFFVVLFELCRQLVVHRRGISKWITVRRALAVALIVLVSISALSVGLAAYGQATLSKLGLSSSGIYLDNVWAQTTGIVTNANNPGIYKYLSAIPLSILGPIIPVSSGYPSLNKFSANSGAIESAMTQLMQHNGLMNSADLAHFLNLGSTTLIPLITQDSPSTMTLQVWNLLSGGNLNAQETIASYPFSNYASFLTTVEASTSFASLVAFDQGWGWIEPCSVISNSTCAVSGTIFVPVSRYWSPTALALTIEYYANQGYTPGQVASFLEGLGYSPTYVDAAFVVAGQWAGTGWVTQSNQTVTVYSPNPTGTVTMALLPLLQVTPAGCGSNCPSATFTAGAPEANYIFNQVGQIVYPNTAVTVSNGGHTVTFSNNNFPAATDFAGVSYTDQDAAIAAGCGQGNGCGYTSTTGGIALNPDLMNFWAAELLNGGWGGVQGGYVPSVTFTGSEITAVGQQLQASGATGDPYQLGYEALEGTMAYIDGVAVNGYPITTAFPGVNGVPIHPQPGTTCQTGCLSPDSPSWTNFQSNLQAVQTGIATDYAQTGQLPVVGDGDAYGSKFPSPTDSFETQFLDNGVPGYAAGLDPATVKTLLSSGPGSVLSASFENYANPQSPTSGLNFMYGTASKAYPGNLLGSPACQGGCGWAYAIPSGIQDPGCSNAICSNGAGTTSITHYIESDFYQFADGSGTGVPNDPNALTDANAEHNGGIQILQGDITPTDASYADLLGRAVTTAVVNSGLFDAVKVTGSDINQPNPTSVAPYFSASGQYYSESAIGATVGYGGSGSGTVQIPTGANAINTILSLPGTCSSCSATPGYTGYSSWDSQQQITNFQQFYESAGNGLLLDSNGVPISPSEQKAFLQALDSIPLGNVNLGQYFSQHPLAWSGVGVPAVKYALSECAGGCTQTQLSGYLTGYIQTHGAPNYSGPNGPNTPSGSATSPDYNAVTGKTDSAVKPSGPSGPTLGPGDSAASVAWEKVLNTQYSGSYGPTTAGVEGNYGTLGSSCSNCAPGQLQNPNSVSSLRLGLLSALPVVTLNLFSSGGFNPLDLGGIAIYGLFSISWFTLALLLAIAGLALALFLSRKRK